MNKLDVEIYNKLKYNYEKIFKDSFEKFCEMVSLEFESSENKNSSLNYLLVKTIRPTKRRWIKIIMNDKLSSLNKDISAAEISYKKVKGEEIPISKFEDFFGAKDIDQYKQKKLKELNNWMKDDNLYLTDFKYLEEMKMKSITSAFKYDIYLYYLLDLQKQDDFKEKISITKVPIILSELPIDTSCKVDYLSEAQKNNLYEDFDIDIVATLDKLILLEGNEQDEILMRLEKKTYLEIKKGGNPDKFLDMMTQIALLKSIKYLNSFDTRIINYYYNHFENVLTGTPIDKSVYEIAKDLNLPNTTQYYNLIEDSIAKIGSINMTYVMEGNRLFGNLLGCMMYTAENGIKRVKVYLGSILQDLVVKDSAFEYDKDVYNNLSGISQQLAVWLQKRRYKLAINKFANTEDIPIKFFSNAIYFNTKRADRIRKRIVDSLEELKTNNLIIKNYKYNKRLDCIEIEYIELTTKERKKLGILDNDIVEEAANIDKADNIKQIN